MHRQCTIQKNRKRASETSSRRRWKRGHKPPLGKVQLCHVRDNSCHVHHRIPAPAGAELLHPPLRQCDPVRVNLWVSAELPNYTGKNVFLFYLQINDCSLWTHELLSSTLNLSARINFTIYAPLYAKASHWKFDRFHKTHLKDAYCQTTLDKKIKVTAPYHTCVCTYRKARIVLRRKVQVLLRLRRPLRLM